MLFLSSSFLKNLSRVGCQPVNSLEASLLIKGALRLREGYNCAQGPTAPKRIYPTPTPRFQTGTCHRARKIHKTAIIGVCKSLKGKLKDHIGLASWDLPGPSLMLLITMRYWPQNFKRT